MVYFISTCVAKRLSSHPRVVVVLYPHWRHHHCANSWLARLRLRGDARHTGLAVLIATRDEAPLSEGTGAVIGGVRGGRAVHSVAATLLLVVRHAATGGENGVRESQEVESDNFQTTGVRQTCWGVCLAKRRTGLKLTSWCSECSQDY